jgi:type IV secretion system protein VirB6
MSCAPIITGDEFLVRTLSHIDCQAQLLGSYGYQALGQPGSPTSSIVLGLLTLFIALFGLRLMFGPAPSPRDVVYDVVKIGLVLTLALSWPTFRTVVYDVALKGPTQIASILQTSSGNTGSTSFAQRLQRADNQIATLTQEGTGRTATTIINQTAPGASFRAAALEDDNAFGSARVLFMSSVIGSLAVLRIGAGFLLALAPLVAGLYFFPQTRGIFAGWIKGLVFTFAGSIGASLLLSVELAILEPWLRDALGVRGLGYGTPAAPTELFAITLAFAVALLVMFWLLGKVTFHRGWLTLPEIPRARTWTPQTMQAPLPAQNAAAVQILRTERLTNSISSATRREIVRSSERLVEGPRAASTSPASANASMSPTSYTPRLGTSYRRSGRRPSRSAQNRDQT